MRISTKDAARLGRSHVERTLQQALELDDVVTDADGDYPVDGPHGRYYVSVAPNGMVCRVWAVAAWQVPSRAAVLRELNDHNRATSFVRAYLQGGSVVLECLLPVPLMDSAWLVAVCGELQEAASAIGPVLTAVHGGHTDWHEVSEDRCG